MTPLEQAVENAIEEGDIGLIHAALMRRPVSVFGAAVAGEAPSPYFLPTEKEGMMRITATDDPAVLLEMRDRITPIRMSGAALLKLAGDAHEIILVFSDGGYHLDREQLDWFASLVA